MSQEELELNIESEEAIDQLAKNVARGGGIVVAGTIIGKAAHFLLQVLLSRCLKAQAYGMYCLGFTIIVFVVSISSLGLQGGVVRFGSLYMGEGDKARTKGTLIVAIVLSSLASVFAGILLFTFSGTIAARIFDNPDLAGIIQIFSISVPFATLIIMIACIARAFHLMQYDIGLRSVLPPVVRIILIGSAFLLGFGLRGVVLAFLASNILCVLLGTYLLWRIFPDIVSKLKPIYETRRLLRFSLPVLIAGFANLLLVRIDRLMLGWLRGTSDVGIYNAASITALHAGFMLNAFNASFSPVISDLYNRKKNEELKRLFQMTTRWILTVSLPIALILISFPNSIMTLFGPGFRPGWPVLIVLSSACLVNAGVGSAGFMLIMSGRQNIELFNTIAMVSLNVTLNIWLIRLYGITGAAIATGGSMAAINIIRLIEIGLFLKIQPYNRKYIKPLLAGLIAIAIPLFIGSDPGTGLVWIIYSIAMALIYGVSLYLFGFDEEDRVISSIVKGKIRSLVSI